MDSGSRRPGYRSGKRIKKAYLEVTINSRFLDWGKGVGYSNCRPPEPAFGGETELARLR